MTTFNCTSGFCPECGSILPHLTKLGNVTCYNCKSEYNAEIFGEMHTEYTIHFNTYEKCHSSEKQIKNLDTNEENDGPIIERMCPKCGNNKMSYATLQLRSADEGQTVFYTCTKCNFKETENS